MPFSPCPPSSNCPPIAGFSLCPALAALPAGAPSVPGTDSYVGPDCSTHLIPDLCSQITSLFPEPPGVGQFFSFVGLDTFGGLCRQVLPLPVAGAPVFLLGLDGTGNISYFTQAAPNVCAGIQAFPVGAPGVAGVDSYVGPDCQIHLLPAANVFNLCAALAALPAGAPAGYGFSSFVGPDCQTHVLPTVSHTIARTDVQVDQFFNTRHIDSMGVSSDSTLPFGRGITKGPGNTLEAKIGFGLAFNGAGQITVDFCNLPVGFSTGTSVLFMIDRGATNCGVAPLVRPGIQIPNVGQAVPIPIAPNLGAGNLISQLTNAAFYETNDIIPHITAVGEEWYLRRLNAAACEVPVKILTRDAVGLLKETDPTSIQTYVRRGQVNPDLATTPSFSTSVIGITPETIGFTENFIVINPDACKSAIVNMLTELVAEVDVFDTFANPGIADDAYCFLRISVPAAGIVNRIVGVVHGGHDTTGPGPFAGRPFQNIGFWNSVTQFTIPAGAVFAVTVTTSYVVLQGTIRNFDLWAPSVAWTLVSGI